MPAFHRFGLYLVPDDPLYKVASAWLGWDSAAGRSVAHPVVANLPEPAADLTAQPRKYGIHATLKPPFALADGCTPEALEAAAQEFCAAQAPVQIPPLEVCRLGRRVALLPSQPCPALCDLACAAVEVLDPFRAPPSEAELGRRRAAKLTARQEALLQRWGYPYVMEDFRPHITLTGRSAQAEKVRAALAAHFAPYLTEALDIQSLALVGQDAGGTFHILHRYPLSG